MLYVCMYVSIHVLGLDELLVRVRPRRSNVADDFPVVGPDRPNGLDGPNAGPARIRPGTKPVVLRGARRTRSNARVGRTVGGPHEDAGSEVWVAGDDGRGEVVREAFEEVEKGVEIFVMILRDDLEGTKELLGGESGGGGVPGEGGKGHEDRRGLEETVAGGDAFRPLWVHVS